MKLATTHSDYGFDIIDEDCREWQLTVRVTSADENTKFGAVLAIFGIAIALIRVDNTSSVQETLEGTTAPMVPSDLFDGLNSWLTHQPIAVSLEIRKEFFAAWIKCWSDPLTI